MTVLYIIVGLLAGILLMRFRNLFSTKINNTSMFNLLFLALGVAGGLAGAYFLFGKKLGKGDIEKISSSTVVQKIERVFKVVSAEGHFSELFDYTQTEHLFSFIPSTKKALIIVNAKVLMGFDFKKLKISVDETTQKVTIDSFPKPEILSIEPELKYYNLENGLFNKFNNEDLTKLQVEAKQKIAEAVEKSELPAIAQRQMQHLLVELSAMQQWTLQGEDKILSNNNIIEAPKQKVHIAN
jgi:hypothetical protein